MTPSAYQFHPVSLTKTEVHFQGVCIGVVNAFPSPDGVPTCQYTSRQPQGPAFRTFENKFRAWLRWQTRRESRSVEAAICRMVGKEAVL